MVKINRLYLDRALSLVNDHEKASIERSLAQQCAVRAAASAISDKARSDVIFKTNVSWGAMVALVLFGLGVLCALAAGPISQVINGSSQTKKGGIFESPKALPAAGNSQNDPSIITQSVTLFNTTPMSDTNSPFYKVVAGHIFESVYDQNWSRSFCYASIIDGKEEISIELSNYPSNISEIVRSNYVYNERFTLAEFNGARQLCPYQKANF